MGLNSLVERFKERLGIHIFAKLTIYGNCDSCMVDFGGQKREYQNLHDAEQVVRDFDLSGEEVVIKTGEIEYNGHMYHPMRHIHLSNFRTWLKNRGVVIK